jgi:hypothetical protein
VFATAEIDGTYVKPTLPVFVMTTVRFAVSPGTMFERLMSEAAALWSFDIVRVADPNEFAGLVVVAVKLALDLSDVTVRPIRMSAESAMPARRVVDLRI